MLLLTVTLIISLALIAAATTILATALANIGAGPAGDSMAREIGSDLLLQRLKAATNRCYQPTEGQV